MPKKTNKRTASKSSSSAGSTFLALLAFVCIGGAGFMSYEIYKNRTLDQEAIEMANSASSNVDELLDITDNVIDGGPEAIDTIRSIRLEVNNNVLGLRASSSHLAKSDPSIDRMLKSATADWSEISTQIELLESFKSPLMVRFDLRSQITDQIDTMENAIEAITEAVVNKSGTAQQVFMLTSQSQILRDLSQSVIEVGDEEVQKQATLVKEFGRNLRSLLNGSEQVSPVRTQPARGQLTQMAQLFSDLRAQFENLYSSASQIKRARKAVDTANRLGTALQMDLSTLTKQIDDAATGRPINPQRAAIAGIAGFVLLTIFIVTSIRSNAERAREANNTKGMLEEGNRHRQEEMQRLVSEMHPLTAGDLTSQASEGGAFTKQIAHVFNKAIASLRDIVNRLQLSSMEIASAAEQSHRTSENLKAVRKRNEQTLNSTASMAEKMDNSITKIGQHASETARSSSESAQAVEAGRQSVEKTHRAVEVADTSIRVSADMVKKLGEEIQQIESITMTIREITDNLQSLSYNTQLIADRSVGDEKDAISATADKMENLAKTVFGSLEEITHIVNGISGRTAETQSHIEKNRGDFVDLVKNSNTTLRAFELIGDATTKSHENVRQIEAEAQQLTTTSQRFIDNIKEIQNLSRDSSAATEETTEAINKLTALSNDLKEVAGKFRTGRPSGIETA